MKNPKIFELPPPNLDQWVISPPFNPHLGVSKNRGTPRWRVYNGKSFLKWMIWGETLLFSETSIYKKINFRCAKTTQLQPSIHPSSTTGWTSTSPPMIFLEGSRRGQRNGRVPEPGGWPKDVKRTKVPKFPSKVVGKKFPCKSWDDKLPLPQLVQGCLNHPQSILWKTLAFMLMIYHGRIRKKSPKNKIQEVQVSERKKRSLHRYWLFPLQMAENGL